MSDYTPITLNMSEDEIIAAEVLTTIIDNTVSMMSGAIRMTTFLSTGHNVNRLTESIRKNVSNYHNTFDQPLKSTYWEEVLHKSFIDINFTTTWRPNESHRVGEDMRIDDLESSRISCKSGQILNNSVVEYSGSRTTRHRTLRDKIDFLATRHHDYHFMLAKSKPFNGIYRLLIIKEEMANVGDLDWHSDGDNYVSVGGPFEAKIVHNMSGQLWVKLPLERVEHDIVIDVRHLL
jgi:hypothetical protein